MMEDVCGDPAAGLAVFLAGNQFMVLPALVAGFLQTHPEVGSVFYETLPPGVVLDQFRRGGLRVGTLELRVRPDVLALSPDRLTELQAEGLTDPGHSYARNDLAMLVAADNPLGVTGLGDLGRANIRVALPDPRTEGIGRLTLAALETVGGLSLRRAVEVDKRRDGTAVFTTIHHRQSPDWLEAGAVDAAVVWSTEARHHLACGRPFALVNIPPEQNRMGDYAAAVVRGAPHPAAAAAFVAYLCGPAGQACYRERGFAAPIA